MPGVSAWVSMQSWEGANLAVAIPLGILIALMLIVGNEWYARQDDKARDAESPR